MLMRGQEEPSAMRAETAALRSVQGQPIFPGGGGGNSIRAVRRIEASLTSDSLIELSMNPLTIVLVIPGNLRQFLSPIYGYPAIPPRWDLK